MRGFLGKVGHHSLEMVQSTIKTGERASRMGQCKMEMGESNR